MDELSETQDRLIDTEKMAALGELTAIISHELKSPLGAISAAQTVLNESFITIHNQAFEIAIFTNEEERKSIAAFVTTPIVQNQILAMRDKELRKERLLKSIAEFSKKEVITDEITSLLIDLNVEGDLQSIKPLLRSPIARKILEYLKNYQVLKTSLWIMKNSIERSVKLIEELKNHTYNHNGESKDIQLIDSINSVLAIYDAKLGSMKITTNYQHKNQITGDPDKITQIWINLILNSAQASNYSGKLEITTEEDEKHVSVIIKDYAGGIPKEIQNKIFQPFFTTKPKGEGTGLGLSIVKRIIEVQNGSIQFDVEEGQSTKAIVKFKKIEKK